jgi:hypothetical protein
MMKPDYLFLRLYLFFFKKSCFFLSFFLIDVLSFHRAIPSRRAGAGALFIILSLSISLYLVDYIRRLEFNLALPAFTTHTSVYFWKDGKMEREREIE